MGAWQEARLPREGGGSSQKGNPLLPGLWGVGWHPGLLMGRSTQGTSLSVPHRAMWGEVDLSSHHLRTQLSSGWPSHISQGDKGRETVFLKQQGLEGANTPSRGKADLNPPERD